MKTVTSPHMSSLARASIYSRFQPQLTDDDRDSAVAGPIGFA